MAVDDDMVPAVRFSVVRENMSTEQSPKSFTLKMGAETPIRIGRAPANDIVVEGRGVSQYHAELRVLRLSGESTARLCVRDLSMNGTGVKRPDQNTSETLEKRKDAPLSDGSIILVPMLLKVTQDPADRAWLKVDIESTTMESADEAPAKEAAAAGGNGQSEEDTEKARMCFVQLLLKTREVSAGTSYEEAKKLLSGSDDWHAVDESTRKECFDIFVEHLRTHQSAKKKDKKKGKEDKKGKKSKNQKGEEEDAGKDAAAGTPEPKASHKEEKKKRRRSAGSGGGSDAGSPERKRKKKGGGRRSKSRGRSAGASASPAPRKRRHG